MDSSPTTAAAEKASGPVVATLDNPLRVVVGGQSHSVVVTNRADEASEWVRRLPEEDEGKTRIIGVSFNLHEEPRADGFVSRHVISFHLASAGDGLYSPDVLSFLRRPANLFVGDDVDEALYLLGLDYRPSARRTMDLIRVAQLYGADHLVSFADLSGVPLHVVLAMNILGIAEGELRVDRGSASPANWPLTAEQVELAIQSAAVAQSLGLRAYLREKLPPLE